MAFPKGQSSDSALWGHIGNCGVSKGPVSNPPSACSSEMLTRLSYAFPALCFAQPLCPSPSAQAFWMNVEGCPKEYQSSACSCLMVLKLRGPGQGRYLDVRVRMHASLTIGSSHFRAIFSLSGGLDFTHKKKEGNQGCKLVLNQPIFNFKMSFSTNFADSSNFNLVGSKRGQYNHSNPSIAPTYDIMIDSDALAYIPAKSPRFWMLDSLLLQP
ncbi:hypothetical protein VNO77_19380 [Canavalia gladiata]|uniref:Uncharacterized protein n=1 Tax=Canavalia gladiata TaxID=3824 RepID=A0AAN9QKF3_CANGL